MDVLDISNVLAKFELADITMVATVMSVAIMQAAQVVCHPFNVGHHTKAHVHSTNKSA